MAKGVERMNLIDRIGIDVGRKLTLEDAVEWAAEHRVRYIDIQLDAGDNALGTISGIRGARIRGDVRASRRPAWASYRVGGQCRRIRADRVGDAVEAYLKAYVDASVRLGAKWIVMHAGLPFHFGQGAAHAGRARTPEAHHRLRREQGRADPAGKPQQGA